MSKQSSTNANRCLTVAGNPPQTAQEANSYRGNVPLRDFIGFVLLIVLGTAAVGFLMSQLLVNKRQQELITETASRVETQGQNKAKLIAEWLNGQLKMVDQIAGSQLTRMMVADQTGQPLVPEASSAIQAQKPYMQQVLADFVTTKRAVGIALVQPSGQIIMSSGEIPEPLSTNTHLLQAVQKTGEGRILPLRQGANGLVLDVLRPIRTVADTPVEGKDDPTLAVLWSTIPAGPALAALLSPLPGDRTGERTLIIQNTQGQAEVMGQGTLAKLNRPITELESDYNQGRILNLSVTDGTATFGTLVPVADTPFYVLQEYASRYALALLALYKPGLYTITSLATLVLGALMLALTLHLMAQRNKVRVKLMGQTMEALVRAVEARDAHLAGHHAKVSRMVISLSNAMHMPVGQRATLFYAAQLSAVGRLMVPRDILAKSGKLTAAERKELESHLASATDVLHDLDFDLPIVSVISEMYEREDGTGHPCGLNSAQISQMGKVLAVADAYVALTSARAHRPAMSPTDALKLLDKGQFSAQVVSTLRSVVK